MGGDLRARFPPAAYRRLAASLSAFIFVALMPEFIENQADYLVLVAVSVGVAALLRRWLAKKGVFYGPAPIWFTLGALLVSGWFFTNSAGDREKTRIRQLMDGFPPTYAVELERLNHAAISASTKPNDPTYLQLIDAEKRWLEVNPYINDIYTIGKDPDGRHVMLVDSETDYDHNGRVEGEREQRTAVGEPYPAPDPSLTDAFAGKASFSSRPYTDRWGSWVSSYFPLRDAQGKVTAVVGVDFDAKNWLAVIRRARLGAIGLVLVASLLCLSIVAGAEIRRLERDNEEQRKMTAIQKAGRERFETLVNSIDGIVYEFNLQSGLFEYVSNQAETILGFPPSMWLNKKDFWESRLAVDDKDKVIKARKGFLRSRTAFEVEYHLVHADGKSVRVRERSQAISSLEAPTHVRGVLFDVTHEARPC